MVNDPASGFALQASDPRPEPRAPNPEPRAPNPEPRAPSLFACLYVPPARDVVDPSEILLQIASAFSPRYELHGTDCITIDIRGLERLLGTPQTIGEELRRDVMARGLRAHVAVAATQTTAMVMAVSRAGLTVVRAGDEAARLAPVPFGILEKFDWTAVEPSISSRGSARVKERSVPSVQKQVSSKDGSNPTLASVKHWGIRTLGEFVALGASDVLARLGARGRTWHAMARGEDTRPLVPAVPDERFDAFLELEWPIEELEPLSFVVTRLLEPLSTRLERRDRAVAALHLSLRLVTKETHARRLELPTPMRDVRTLRTLLLLDLESHPPVAAIDRVAITIDPTPGRILQHTLFARPHPTPEQLSTLLARLHALMGQSRVGSPVTVDSHRPGAFAMARFAIERPPARAGIARASARQISRADAVPPSPEPGVSSPALLLSNLRDQTSNLPSPASGPVVSALRRCRQPVPARVVAEDGRPWRVTTDRRGYSGGAVLRCAGPWRTSGAWWEMGRAGGAGGAGKAGGAGRAGTAGGAGTAGSGGWNREEWDVALSDGVLYRIFRDRRTDAWFLDAVID